MFSNLNPPVIDVAKSDQETLLIKQHRLPEALGIARLPKWHGDPLKGKILKPGRGVASHVALLQFDSLSRPATYANLGCRRNTTFVSVV